MAFLDSIKLLRGELVFSPERTLVCGVVNATPDSFAGGDDTATAIARGRRLVEEGADIIDVGGESTRPGATAITAGEELARVLPVIAALAPLGVPLSVDTTKAAVARAAIAAGASIVNDVSGGAFDRDMIEVVHATGAAYVLGHLRGTSLAQVHEAPAAGVGDVIAELGDRLAALPPAVRACTIVDPGLGFGKHTTENLDLIAATGRLARELGRPVMLGPSRKRFLGELTGRPVGERDDATVGAVLAGVAAGCQLVRVHDVRGVRDALIVWHAVRRAGAA